MNRPDEASSPDVAEARARLRSRLVLLLLAALFLGPLSLSFALYYGWHWRPPGQTNHGTLIEPAQSLPTTGATAVLAGKWSLVYVGPGDCDNQCRSTLYFIRQTQLGMAQLMPRVQQVFLVTWDCCDRAFLAREHPALLTIDLASTPQLLRQFPPDHRPTTVFVVDPKGNLMMRYDAHASPKGLHEDLQKLLNLSHIG